MTTTLTIAGPTFTNIIQPKLPTITNLRTLAFFGSAGDGFNGNRVNGGPAIAIQSGAPVYATNFVNLGQQAAGTRWDVLDTQNPHRIDAPALAAGFTWCNVYRMAVAPVGSTSIVFSDTKGTSQGQSFLIYGSNPTTGSRLTMALGGSSRGWITQVASSPLTAWHFAAMTYTGGGAGTFNLYDFTENNTTGLVLNWPTTGITWAVGNQSPHIGTLQTSEAAGTQAVESAFFMVAASVLDAPTLTQVYQWTKSNLARRGITI